MSTESTAPSGAVIDLRTFINERRLSAFQWSILCLCFLIVFIDGVDTGAVGYVAPALVQAFKVKREALGPVLSAALVGLAIGAAFCGPIADRIGRKKVLVASVFLFGLGSLASAWSTDLTQLTWTRLFTGLGLGAAMPNAITLTSEYAPEKKRSLFVTGMFCGYTFGSALGGFIAAGLIPRFGWPSVFLAGGLFPMALTVLLALVLPESARFLAARGRSREEVARILVRIDPTAQAEVEAASAFVVDEPAPAAGSGPLRAVLTPPMLVGTLLMWVVFFCGLSVIFLMTSWLPTLLKGAGFSLEDSAILGALFQIGGTAGAVLAAWGMGRFGMHRTLATCYGLGCVAILLLAANLQSVPALAIGVLATGFFVSGAQTGMNALAPAFYPTAMRATGVASMHAFGRLGAIIGAYIGAPLLSIGWGFASIIQILAVPAIVACIALSAKGAIYRNRAG